MKANLSLGMTSVDMSIHKCYLIQIQNVSEKVLKPLCDLVVTNVEPNQIALVQIDLDLHWAQIS